MSIIKLKSAVTILSKQLIKKKLIISTAESCTGGMIAQYLTDLSGSSAWFDRGFVTYSNQAKQEMLNVPCETIANNGAVSEATVIAMAEGALKNSNANISIACSGIAGPTGGTIEKPVGTVWVAWAYANQVTKTKRFQFKGNRQVIRQNCTLEAIKGVFGSL